MFSLKNLSIPIDLITYGILKFVSYFELDNILPCFKLTHEEQSIIKSKIYNQRLTIIDDVHETEYRIEGKLHREDGPAKECATGRKEWRINGELHRLDGPALEYASGTKEWYIYGNLHREGDLPAEEWISGTRKWFVNGKLHRDNGLPAIEWTNGSKEWYIDGFRIR